MELASLYTVPLSVVNGLSRFDYDEQWAGTADSKIFESAHDFQIESNVEASQGPSEHQSEFSLPVAAKLPRRPQRCRLLPNAVALGMDVSQGTSSRCANFQLKRLKVRRTAAQYVGTGSTWFSGF